MTDIRAEVESVTLPDAAVRTSGQVTVATINGFAHAGGADQDAADAELAGYWLILIVDRDADGVLTVADEPLALQWYYVSMPGRTVRPTPHHVAGQAVGWDGSAANLLPADCTFVLKPGVMYLLAIVVLAADGRYSADVAWREAATPWVQQLRGLTADGLLSRDLGDYEAVRFRCNLCEAPQRA
jgi:hypothetical protein